MAVCFESRCSNCRHVRTFTYEDGQPVCECCRGSRYDDTHHAWHVAVLAVFALLVAFALRCW